ncbi:hypothetical protein RhiirA1_481510, partial [Rhizophagus irregularis]
MNKYFDGFIPTKDLGATDFDSQLVTHAVETRKKFEENMEKMQFSVVLADVWSL